MDYEIKMTASGELRDVDGNLISTHPVEATTIITQEQLDELTAAHHPEGE